LLRVVLGAEAFFAGLRVDVGLVIGFFAEVGFLTDFCVFAGLTAFAILSSPDVFGVVQPRSTVVIRVSSANRFFLALSTIVRLTLLPQCSACRAEWIDCACNVSNAEFRDTSEMT